MLHRASAGTGHRGFWGPVEWGESTLDQLCKIPVIL